MCATPWQHTEEEFMFSALNMIYAYNLKAVFSSLAFLNFGCPFVVTACTHSHMSLKSGGLQPPPPSLLPTPLNS